MTWPWAIDSFLFVLASALQHGATWCMLVLLQCKWLAQPLHFGDVLPRHFILDLDPFLGVLA